MDRKEAFEAYRRMCENQKRYDGTVIPALLADIARADQAGQLRQFVCGEAPYRSAELPNAGSKKRKKINTRPDIVMALNLYGAEHPGFALRLSKALKEAARGTNGEARHVLALLDTQTALQADELSLIDFIDRELMELVNQYLGQRRRKDIALACLLCVAGAIGAPGFAMLGLVIFSLPCGLLCFFSLMMLVGSICSRGFTEEDLRKWAREVKCRVGQAAVCTGCGKTLDSGDKFCSKCGQRKA